MQDSDDVAGPATQNRQSFNFLMLPKSSVVGK